jgi:hypothetical protein
MVCDAPLIRRSQQHLEPLTYSLNVKVTTAAMSSAMTVAATAAAVGTG